METIQPTNEPQTPSPSITESLTKRNSPLVSIITVVWNEAATIAQSLDSLNQQTYPSIEHIIIDAESTDGTSEIIAKKKRSEALHIRESDSGIYEGMNKGLGYATGEIVGFLNGGDIFAYQDCIADIVDTFNKCRADACYGDINYQDARGIIVRSWIAGDFSLRKMEWGWIPPHPGFYARRKLYTEYGGFEPTFNITADYECILRFLYIQKAPVAYLPKTLVTMQTGGTTSKLNLRNYLKGNYQAKLAWQRNGFDIPIWRLAFKSLRKLKGIIFLRN
jgi:glycosyltransferase